MGYDIHKNEPVYNALYYGVVADGSTDDTAAWNALFVTIASAGGGTAVLPAGKTSLCSSVLTPMPFGAASPHLRITGAGSYYPYGDPAAGASVLDLRFNGDSGVHLGKIDCRGYGRLELDHLTLKSGGTDDFLFFYATNTTVYLHDLQFSGHSANSGASCVQDAIQARANPGNLSDITTGAADAPFQGYGTVIERNGFNRIRSAVRLCAAANGVVVRDNTVDNLCGGDTTHGAFTLPSGTVSAPTSNIFSGNLVEVTHYPFVWVFAGGNQNQCVGNSLFDGTTGTNKTVKDAGTGNRFYATAIDGSFTDYPDVGSVQVITSGTSFTPTATGTYLVACVGGGGSGGAGGTPSNTTTQVGGSGGGQGGSAFALMNLVSGTAYTVAIGAGGAATGTTTAGGHAGGNGNAGHATTFAGPSFTLSGGAGAPGFGSAATSTTDISGAMSSVLQDICTGAPGGTNLSTTGLSSPDGCGAGTFHAFGLPVAGGGPLGYGAGGGGGGGQATTTNGGGGGAAGAYGAASGGSNGGSGTANGVAGGSAAATSYGAGGGGGGAGATASGTGGAGGAGGPGVIYVIGPFPQW